MKDHSESIQIDFDENLISFSQMVDLFWKAHSPQSPGFGVQYANKIWFTNKEEEMEIQKSKLKWENSTGKKALTTVAAFTSFTDAEDYHQKYYLRGSEVFQILKFSDEELKSSHYAARLNSWVSGSGTAEQLDEINGWNIANEKKEKIRLGRLLFCLFSQKLTTFSLRKVHWEKQA